MIPAIVVPVLMALGALTPVLSSIMFLMDEERKRNKERKMKKEKVESSKPPLIKIGLSIILFILMYVHRYQ